MSYTCKAPSCDTVFTDAVLDDPLAARESGEIPYFTHVYRPSDGVGVATDYLCSASCMAEYLDTFGGDGVL